MKSRTLAVGVAIGAILSAGLPTQVLAACNPGHPNNSRMSFAGTFAKGVAGARTIKANIEEYSPFIQGDAPTHAWVMLNLGSEWAQAGWSKRASGSRWTWVQWTIDVAPWVEEENFPP